MRKANLLGRQFNRLTVVGSAKNMNGRTAWTCKCECGKKTTVASYNLLNGHTKSCGCLRKYSSGYVDGKKTRLYRIWDAMKQRCSNPNSAKFSYYGGRGIRVCGVWMRSFESFYEWAMDSGYKKHLTIERKDVNGNYEPLNCTWIPHGEQWRNRRNRKSKSGVRGVSWDKRRNNWRARVSLNGKEVYCRCFERFEDACIAVSEARGKYHGLFN